MERAGLGTYQQGLRGEGWRNPNGQAHTQEPALSLKDLEQGWLCLSQVTVFVRPGSGTLFWALCAHPCKV